MSFREKAAWVMEAIIVLAGANYLWGVGRAMTVSGAVPHPIAVLPAVLTIIGASIIAMSVLALANLKEADRPADERERPLIDRARNWSGVVLGLGVIGALLSYLGHRDGDLLFHLVMASLLVSAVAEAGFEIVLLRRG